MLCSYLHSRGIKDKVYLDYTTNNIDFNRRSRLVSVNGFDFVVNQLFDDTDAVGIGLVATNKVLGTDNGNMVAIGAIEGDDIICFDVFTGNIVLWMIENGDGEYIKIADSFAEFVNKCFE